MSDLISRQDAIDAIELSMTAFVYDEMTIKEVLKEIADNTKEIAISRIRHLPSADATKKKAKLKDNGDWDCPDVDCDECDHNRSVSWCSLAIPSHDEIDDTYKMVTEAFFEGFEYAEKRYRFLIEYVEELDKKSADAVHGEWIEVEDYNGDVHYKCNQCGEEWTFPFGTPKENNANFCPNCGSRMKGADE